MCLRYIKLKTKNESGTRYGYIPCGVCEDCRRKEQNAWRFRLMSEFSMMKNKGWNVGFITLTYDNKHLPKIPKKLFKNEQDYKEIPCFSRKDVSDFIKNLRGYYKYAPNCNDKVPFTKENAIRYFVASEFGELRHRPHYHMILAWPNTVSYKDMHAKIKELWKYGLVGPQEYTGDASSKWPFEVVGDISKAMNYVSKYACKDISFRMAIKDIQFRGLKENNVPKMCDSFHIQSKCLGFELIKNMDDNTKMELFRNGMSFVGDGQTYQIPMYIKNKLVFDVYYVVDENGDRLVRRKASEFFEKNKDELFNEKAKFYTKYFAESSGADFYKVRGVSEELSNQFERSIQSIAGNICDYLGFDSISKLYDNNVIGQLYLAYAGVRFDRCYNDEDLVNQWMRRYRTEEWNRHDARGKDLIDPVFLRMFNDYVYLINGCNTYVGISKLKEREDESRIINKLRDYFNNVLKNKLI